MEGKVSHRVRRALTGKTFVLFAMLVAVIAIFSIINPNYLKVDNFRTIFYDAALSGTLMIGFGTLLISGNADMSVAAVGCFAAVLCCKMIVAGVPWGLAVVFGLVMGGAMGGFNALLWYKFNIVPFIGTMGMSFVWQGLAGFITRSTYVNVNNKGFFTFASGSIPGIGVPISFVYVVAFALIYGFILSYTKFGRQVYMCGGNVFAARLSGVSVTKIGTIMMINCSALSAFGGIALASRMHQIAANSMQTTLMDSITAAFLGGISFGGGSGSMLGAFFGLLLLNFFNSGLVMIGVGTYWQFTAQGLLLIIALAADYFSRRVRERQLKLAR
jgi:ribose/xylose/arabinose/galactoside ABC-type transport system permease subunit